MIEACPNIQELHAGSKFDLPSSCKDRFNKTESSNRAFDFFSRIKFPELTTLTYTGLCLKDGANFDHHLPSVRFIFCLIMFLCLILTVLGTSSATFRQI